MAVSVAPSQDNEGYLVNLVDTARAQYYVAGSGVVTVPVTGSPDQPGTFLGEGVYMPDGNLFVSRACCQGNANLILSGLMWEVSPGGLLVHQVAIGYPNLIHYRLDVSSDGQWLLYLAGAVDSHSSQLYVSRGGAAPRELTTGLVAAAWN